MFVLIVVSHQFHSVLGLEWKKRIRVVAETVHVRCQKFGEVATSVSFVRDSKQRTICADSILLEDAGELIVLVRSTWGRKSGTSF